VSIHLYSSNQILSADQVRGLPSQSKSTDWHGAPLSVPLSWTVAVDPRAIWCVCCLPGGLVSAASGSSGEFREGLWNGDVAELFLKGRDGSYQELNLSPSGAWWSMTFIGYRERHPTPGRPKPLHISTAVGAHGWEVIAAFGRESLDVEIAPAMLIHVSGMWYTPGPVYLSSLPPQGVEPDYHHAECFQSGVLVEYRGS